MLRWLGSPFTAGAVAVLALNDHVLKLAWPGLVTGKLSDAAGLVVAPPLVALALALVRLRWSPLLVTAVGFAVVKTVPLAADAASTALGWVAGPSYIRADPTDLLTLPALVLAHHARRTSTDATSLRRRVRLAIGALVLPFAVVATAATSPCPVDRGAFAAETFTGEWSDAPGRDSSRVVVNTEATTTDLVTVDDRGRVGRVPPGDVARLRDIGSYRRLECTTARPVACWEVETAADRWTVVRMSGATVRETEYTLAGDELEELLEGLGESCGEPREADPRDLAVLDGPAGTVVVVAAGNAGLLVRSPDGSWRRVRMSRLPRSTDTTETPAPGPDGLLTQRPSPTPTPTPSGPPPLPCRTPSLRTVTPDPRNGPPTVYPGCPPVSR